MELYESILAALKERYKKEKNYKKIAKQSGITYSYLYGLIHGTNDPKKLSLEKFFQLFPLATIDLYGDSVSIRADHNKGAVVGVNHGNVATDFLSSVMDKILAADELTDEEKVKVLRVLKKG